MSIERVPETPKEKFVRKFKENPFVPIGAAATTAAMVVALVKMQQGKRKQFNNWLRVRVIAQGLTIAALLAGTYIMRPQAINPSPEELEEKKMFAQMREREEFQERMRAAEEIDRLERGEVSGPLVSTGVKAEVEKAGLLDRFREGSNAGSSPSPAEKSPSGGVWSWFGGSSGKKS